MAERVRTALKYVKQDKLVLNPDCGFGWSPRNMCNGKLKGLAAGPALVRDAGQAEWVGQDGRPRSSGRWARDSGRTASLDPIQHFEDKNGQGTVHITPGRRREAPKPDLLTLRLLVRADDCPKTVSKIPLLEHTFCWTIAPG